MRYKGLELFNNICAKCHGLTIRGAEAGPPLLDDIYRSGHHADLALFNAVKQGVRQHHWRYSDMPPVIGISPEQTAHITAYVRQQQRRVGIR